MTTYVFLHWVGSLGWYLQHGAWPDTVTYIGNAVDYAMGIIGGWE